MSLEKSLYGLKQAPRCWNRKFGNFLYKKGFTKSEADPCIFVRHRQQQKLILALYVDDGLIASTSEEQKKQFIDEIKSEFKITEKEATHYLGLQLEQLEDGSIKISQESYTGRILERFGMSNCKPTTTPILKQSERVKSDDDRKTESTSKHRDEFPYRSAVGALLYLTTGSRPDIAFAVGVASRKLENPSPEDVICVKRIFRYLKGTQERGLVYKSGYKKGMLEGYSDADHGGDQETSRSTTGVVCMYAGGAISWFSQRQTSVAISTTEAEIIAASEGAREIVWLNRLLNSMTDITSTPELQIDNQAAVKLAENPELHRRTKHIRIRHFYVREQVVEGSLEVKKVSSEFQAADMFTKALQAPRLSELSKIIGLE